MAQELLGKARNRIGRLGERWRPSLRRNLRPNGPGNMQPGPAPLEEPEEARGPEPPSPRKADEADAPAEAPAEKKTTAKKTAGSSKPATADKTPVKKAPAKRTTAKKAPAAKTPKAAEEAASQKGAADANGDGPAKKDLYERARELDIPGRSKMSKQELADAISKAEKGT
ncbi:Rho termination factor N-terminal domain-containing protein [Spirillospora sp. NPDC048911]|uniref:Rho termination factor N-terminal domain-containing protein n=1 Tax=Spirillospora sp. NPDC048911 TaxID=3364527 RepID=UPI003719CDC7